MRTLAYGVELTDIRLPYQPKRKPVHDSPQPSNVRLPRLGPPCVGRGSGNWRHGSPISVCYKRLVLVLLWSNQTVTLDVHG